MSTRAALTRRASINGYGRIGRCLLRALYARPRRPALSIVAVNDLAPVQSMVYLTERDSVHGRFPAPVRRDGDDAMAVAGDRLRLLSEPDAERLPWGALGVELVFECSGALSSADELRRHARAGAGKVLLSWPGTPEVPVFIAGLGESSPPADADIASAGSCTSNAILPVIDVLDRAFGVVSGVVTTLHAAMNDQPWTDRHHRQLRLARAAGHSMIPVPTALAQGVGRVLPHLAGRFVTSAVRVPVLNVSAMDMTLQLSRRPSADGANAALAEACAGRLSGLVGTVDEPLVSWDFVGDPRSGVVDVAETRTSGHLLRVLVWFDNEWAFANRMLELALRWLGADASESAGAR